MQNFIKRAPIIFGPAILILAVFAVGFLMYWSVPKKGDVIVIDCRLAEISPDIPIWAKEECRKANAEKIDKQPK